jgi:hypothetical protein
MITLVSFSNDRFKRAAILQQLQFSFSGGRRIIHYTPEDLSPKFKKMNRETLDLSRGAGYWLWKPHIILDALERSRPNEIVLYIDSGITLRTSIEIFESILDKNKITVWQSESRNTVKKWTHPTVIEHFSLTDSEQAQLLIMAGAIAIPKNIHNVNFIRAWLSLCENKFLLRPETLTEFDLSDYADFIWHRHDSSLLSMIVYRNQDQVNIGNNTNFEEYFNLHRNPYPVFFLLSFNGNFLLELKRILKRCLPKPIKKLLILLKLQLVANRKGLSRQELLKNREHLMENEKLP